MKRFHKKHDTEQHALCRLANQSRCLVLFAVYRAAGRQETEIDDRTRIHNRATTPEFQAEYDWQKKTCVRPGAMRRK